MTTYRVLQELTTDDRILTEGTTIDIDNEDAARSLLESGDIAPLEQTETEETPKRSRSK